MASEADNQIQSRVHPFQKWLIKQLAEEGFGRNTSAVVARIIGEWITDKEEWLTSRNLTYDRFSKLQSNPQQTAEPPVDDATAGVVLSYPKERVQEDDR